MSTNDTTAFDPDNPFESDPELPGALEDLPYDDPTEQEPEELSTEFDRAIFEDDRIDKIIKDYQSSKENYQHLRKIFEDGKKDL